MDFQGFFGGLKDSILCIVCSMRCVMLHVERSSASTIMGLSVSKLLGLGLQHFEPS